MGPVLEQVLTNRVLQQGAAMGLCLGLAALLPRDRTHRFLSPDTAINLLNGLVLFIAIAPLVRWVSARANLGLLDLSAVGGPLVQFLVAFLLLDFARYWLHRAGHRVPLLWRFHRVHHSSERLDATSGLRMHAVDFVQLSAVPILLFGVLLDASATPWVVPAALGVGVFFDAFQHANLRFDVTRPWWRAWHAVLNNPHFHSWHHTREGHLYDGNYGNTLRIWDRLFGSDVTRPELPAAFGLAEDQALAGTREREWGVGVLAAVGRLQLLQRRSS